MIIERIRGRRLGTATSCVLVLGASLALAACQSKGEVSIPMNSFQAEAAFYECIRDTRGRRVLGTGGNRAVARRFVSLCSSELSDWEDALVANGTPPGVASERIDTARNDLIDRIADNLSGPI